MPAKTYKVIGLMSGSSLDGLDIACCRFTFDPEADSLDQFILSWEVEHAATLPFSEKWQTRLHLLPQQNALIFAKTNVYFGHYTAALVKQYLETSPFEADFIAAHGHTIFHYPDDRVTVQIGDGAALAALSGLPVVCDFRTHDIALDGEGAPLAPLADRLLLSGYDFYLNLGGIANLSAKVGDRFVAFDVGPANQILNALAQQLDLPYDEGGQLAAAGKVIEPLLARVNEIPYFQQSYPKSLDNEWVKTRVLPLYANREEDRKDLLATAVEQLAEQISADIESVCHKEKLHKENYRLLVSGGGALNTYLIDRIRMKAKRITLVLPDLQLIQFKEAALMALMGVLRVENRFNCFRSVTGARMDTVGGAIYQGTKKLI